MAAVAVATDLKLNEVKGMGSSADQNAGRGGVWTLPCDWICITTNAIVKRAGDCVMGAGIAGQAVKKLNGCEFTLGAKIRKGGNHVYHFGTLPITPLKFKEQQLISFPTKDDYRDKSDIALIEQSCKELLELWYSTSTTDGVKRTKLNPEVKGTEVVRPVVCMPKPGCLNGGLDYQTTVRPVLLKYFGTPEVRDYFIICL
jgi:hypothetical protein